MRRVAGTCWRVERVETLAVSVKGGVRPYRYRILHNDQVAREGVGAREPINPFLWQDISLPWPVASGGSGLRFELTDAAGSTFVQRFTVIDDATLDALPPNDAGDR